MFMVQEKNEKYGNITFGDTTKLLMGIIGQPAILSQIPESERDSYKKSLERIYKDEAPFFRLAVPEPDYSEDSPYADSPQAYCELFFNELIENYRIPTIIEKVRGKERKAAIARVIIDSFTWQLFYSVLSFTPFEYTQHEILLYLIRRQVFGYVDRCVNPSGDNNEFHLSEEKILLFLTDSYKRIFNDAARKSTKNSVEELSKQVEYFYSRNSDKYKYLISGVDKEKEHDFSQEIKLLSSETTYNITWKMLKPILDFMYEKNAQETIHRLLAHYFFKNAQRALTEVCGITKNEQDKIILDTVTMIREKRQPQEFYNDNYGMDSFFSHNMTVITCLRMCMRYLVGEHIEVEKIEQCITEIERNGPHYKAFFSPWLKAKLKTLLCLQSGNRDSNELEEISNLYREAFDKGKYFAGGYLTQFLFEAIAVELYFFTRRTKNRDCYYGFGFALEIFNNIEFKSKAGFYNWIKDGDIDLKEQLLRIGFYHSPAQEPDRIIQQQHIEAINKSILVNNKGLEYTKNKQYTEALKCFDTAIELNPNYANAYSNRGNAYQSINKHDLALSDFNKTLAINPQHENTLYNRGLLLMKMEQFETAIKDFTEVIRLNSKASDAHVMRGNCSQTIKNYNMAIDDYSKAIEIKPDSSIAYLNRGIVYKLIGEINKGKDDILKAYELDPKFVISQIIDQSYQDDKSNTENLINEEFFSEVKERTYDKEIAAYTEAIKIDSKSAPAFIGRGYCYFKKGLYDKAIADYDVALSLEPNNIGVYKICEWALYFKKWAENHQNHIEVITLINCAIEFELGKWYDAALEKYETVIKTSPDNAFVFYQRGLMYAANGENVKAIKDFTEAIGLAPEIAETYYCRGNRYFEQEIYDRAIDDYTMAIQIYPKFSDAIYHRGVAFLEQKEYKSAVEDFKAVLSIDPNDVDAKINLQELQKYIPA